MALENIELPEYLQQWANVVLTWVGFGTLVGLLAKAIMPGRDPGGAIATLLMGVGGAVIGCGVLSYYSGHRVTPISVVGFVAATGGAFLILFFYRLLGGQWFVEGERPNRNKPHGRRRRRVYEPVSYDD